MSLWFKADLKALSSSFSIIVHLRLGAWMKSYIHKKMWKAIALSGPDINGGPLLIYGLTSQVV